MCTYVDLVASDSYIQVNKKMIYLVGLVAATYWATILNIVVKVKKKNAVDANGYFTIDRQYIKNMTQILIEDQLDCDNLLQMLGVLEINQQDPDKLGIKLKEYTEILINDNIKQLSCLKKVAKVTRAQKAQNKQAAIIFKMKTLIMEPDQDLRLLYEAWVDSVYASKRFLTGAKIQLFENKINEHAKNKEDKKKLLEKAIQTGYTEADWLFTNYNNKGSNVSTAKSIKETSAVAKDIVF